MNEISVGPGKSSGDHEKAETRALAQLRQSVWEASQFVSFSYIKGYVNDVCKEIKSDEP